MGLGLPPLCSKRLQYYQWVLNYFLNKSALNELSTACLNNRAPKNTHNNHLLTLMSLQTCMTLFL